MKKKLFKIDYIKVAVGASVLAGAFSVGFLGVNQLSFARAFESAPENEIIEIIDHDKGTIEEGGLVDEPIEIDNSWDTIEMTINDMQVTLVDWSYDSTIMPHHLSIEEAAEIMGKIAHEEYGINLEGAEFEMSFMDLREVGVEEIGDGFNGNFIGREIWSTDIIVTDGSSEFNLYIDAITGEILYVNPTGY